MSEICKNCKLPIFKKGSEWRHEKTGFWKCLVHHAEPVEKKK